MTKERLKWRIFCVKKNIVISIIAVLLFSVSTIWGITSRPQQKKSTEFSSHLPVCCERAKPNFWLPFCHSAYTEEDFSGSIIDTLEPPVVKQPGVKYIKEYKGKPSILYSAEYTLPNEQKLRKYLAHREVDLTCIKKNNVSRYCCTAIFPRAFGIDERGIDRVIFQNTGIQCDRGETLKVEWIRDSDENEKGMVGLEKMGMVIKGKVVVRQEERDERGIIDADS